MNARASSEDAPPPFVLSAVTLDETAIRRWARSMQGKLIRLDEKERYGHWNELLYACIARRRIKASVRSRESIWVLLAEPLERMPEPELRWHARDACGDEIEPLARLRFAECVARVAPHGVVQYIGSTQMFISDSWKQSKAHQQALDVAIKMIAPGRWLIAMTSVLYTSEIGTVANTARCFVVRSETGPDATRAVPTRKNSTAGHLAYATVSAIATRVPWKGRNGATAMDRYTALQLLTGEISVAMGARPLPCTIFPLHAYRKVGTTNQRKTELTHAHVMARIADRFSGKIIHVFSHLGRPEFLSSLMAAQCGSIKWQNTFSPMDDGDNLEGLLAVVNTPSSNGDDGEDDIKARLRARRLPVLQCITDRLLEQMRRSIQRRAKREDRIDAEGLIETRRPAQFHETVARALMVQLVLKYELHSGRFLLERPWMDAITDIGRYAFIYRDFGDPAWIIVRPSDSTQFTTEAVKDLDVQTFHGRTPVIIDPPAYGKDGRGKVADDILTQCPNCVLIRSTPINFFSSSRRANAGIWIIPELFAYVAMGSDAGSSDLSCQVAPRVRIVETYRYGVPTDGQDRRKALLDMATLSYDPTIRMFRTSAFPVFFKLAAEAMELIEPRTTGDLEKP
ncbi:hypothetical protein [Massilia sp. CCM 8734]|uniref:hypothetical protein n=1 Tax=Massilia sp. CCM 8734 TaxID=2609283 RepID=UPI00141E24B5|nr:hypothetical protein [Massilia sp. CCM 8734]NHZ97543.1 hypothetical protein [Massilia sp. CCM 8734]